MRTPRLDRSDLVLTKVVLVLLGLAVPVLTVGGPLLHWWRGGPLTWQLDGLAPSRVSPDLTPTSGTTLRGTGSVLVRVDGAAAGTWLVSLLPGIVLSVAAIIVAWQLLRVIDRIHSGRPFAASTASAFRVIALALFLGGLALDVARGVADGAVSQRALGADGLSVEVSLLPAIGALVVLALGEAFALGARLQDDVEGLV